MTTTKTIQTCDRSLGKRRPRQTARPLDEYPELMTVTEAATYLRIATSTAYVLANLHLDGTGQECMPAIRVGGCIRIIRHKLANSLGNGELGVGSSSPDRDFAR